MARVVKKSATQTSPAVKRRVSAKQTAPTTKKRGSVLTKTKNAAKSLKPKAKNKTSVSVDQEIKRDLRDKIRVMKAERDAAIKEQKDAVRRERANGAEVRKELKDALRREQALIKLIDSRDQALRGFSEKWTKEKIAQIHAPPKKRRRRPRNLPSDPVTQ